jgi:hypothetical protein
MQINSRAMRSVAFLTGGVVAFSALVPIQPARADKSKTYKTGAAVLGALGAILIVKGKTVPGVIAGAGAYYAYKKSKDARNEDRYNERYDDNRYDDSRYGQETDNRFPEDADYSSRRNRRLERYSEDPGYIGLSNKASTSEKKVARQSHDEVAENANAEDVILDAHAEQGDDSSTIVLK